MTRFKIASLDNKLGPNYYLNNHHIYINCLHNLLFFGSIFYPCKLVELVRHLGSSSSEKQIIIHHLFFIHDPFYSNQKNHISMDRIG